jgi:selenophosphate synthetase-related protein
MESNQLKNIIQELGKYKGLTRKALQGKILEIFEEKKFDDAGSLDVGEYKVVISCDGIDENLVKNNPRLAGYYSVIVNVNDVVSKGAKPVGFLNIISSSSSRVRHQIAQGMKDGLEKYGLKLLKGHTHPDTSYDAIDAVVVGITKNAPISPYANVDDSILMAVDLFGEFESKGWVRTFDSIINKSKSEILHRLNSVIILSEKGLAHGAKDISGPGVVGTIAMLCESSRLGAIINLESIPKPTNIKLVDWLTTYPGIGFIISTNQPKDCLEVFENHDLSSAVIGRILKEKRIWLSYKNESALFMDLMKKSVFGISSRTKN